MFSGYITSATKKAHHAYQRARMRFPLRPQKRGPHTRVETLFRQAQEYMPKPTREESRARRPWISAGTWRLIDERPALQKVRNHERARVRQLSRQIDQSFKADRKQRVAEAGSAIESELDGGNLQEAWNIAKALYRQAGDRPHKPSRQDLNSITDERRTLYREIPLPAESIPILVQPADVPDGPPTEEEVASAVRRMPKGKVPGPSGMSVDHFKSWLALAEDDEQPDRKAWEVLVTLVQQVFETGLLGSKPRG